MLETWKSVLITEADKYDKKQKTKSGYNPFTFHHCMKGINAALANPEFLENPRKAFAQEFIIKGETGGISHRNIPEDLSNVKFVVSFVNTALRKMKA